MAAAAQRDKDAFTRSARLALAVLVPAILFTMLAGDELGVIEARYQPVKIAAAEAQWTSLPALLALAVPDRRRQQRPPPIKIIAIPHLLSLLAANHWRGKVTGMIPL